MHVLVEKPMTLRADGAFSLVAIAEQRNLQDRDDELEEPNNDNIPFSGWHEHHQSSGGY